MGVGSGLYMYEVVVKRWRSLSHLLMSSCIHQSLHWKLNSAPLIHSVTHCLPPRLIPALSISCIVHPCEFLRQCSFLQFQPSSSVQWQTVAPGLVASTCKPFQMWLFVQDKNSTDIYCVARFLCDSWASWFQIPVVPYGTYILLFYMYFTSNIIKVLFHPCESYKTDIKHNSRYGNLKVMFPVTVPFSKTTSYFILMLRW